MNGEYTEPLSFGGKLMVTADSWKIEYYISGPDLRYSGEFVRVSGSRIEWYIQGFRAAWASYRDLQASLPRDGEYRRSAAPDLHIQVGGYNPGVSIHRFHKMITSEDSLNRLITEYEYAKTRAAKVQEVLLVL